MKSNRVGASRSSDLPSSEVHLWYEVLDPAQDEARRLAAKTTVTGDEWDRCHLYRFADGQRECLAARRMIRSVLSRYLPVVPPARWRFKANAHGRPEIAEPADARSLRFNLSHADGVVVCVVSAHHDVGVDVERLGRRTPLDVADSRFAHAEVAALHSLPESDRPRRFLEYWTLKEAYIKARGAGLSLPLDQFAFDVTRPGRPSIAFEPGFDDQDAHWQFDRLFVGAEHLVAVATRRERLQTVNVVVREFDGARPDDSAGR